MKERERELLEGYLDEELAGEQAQALAGRLAGEPALAAALGALRDERAARLAAFESMEDSAGAERVAGRVVRQVRHDERVAAVLRMLKPVAALAAGVMIFLAGWMGRGWVTATAGGGGRATVYKVVLTDERGRHIEQTFATKDEADAFAAELRQYQDLYRQMQSGQAVPVVAFH